MLTVSYIIIFLYINFTGVYPLLLLIKLYITMTAFYIY